MNKLIIAIDVDDVVADWKGYARQFFNHSLPDGHRLPDSEWLKLERDQRMYSKLPLKAGAIELVQWCKNYIDIFGGELFFLTAIPRKNNFPYAIQDKVHWCNHHFPNVDVLFGPYAWDKANHCAGYHSILIDDNKGNCEDWIKAGGRSHQYKNWEDCREWLENDIKPKFYELKPTQQQYFVDNVIQVGKKMIATAQKLKQQNEENK